ncbi:MAG: type restriction protein res subunit [Candidatus Saccharibacteria bacterium]|nr:type restriction protein res subunit [Candidatus Saccharibacteria bacterium]
MTKKEAYSRVVIDRKLREAGWDIEDEEQVVFEDHSTAGRADYVLKDSKGMPIALIEAKAPEIDPYNAKKQARDYVDLQYKQIDFIYLANDQKIYFWDLGHGDAVPSDSGFFSQSDLERRRASGRVNNVSPLLQEAIDTDYFKDITDQIKLRDYQLDAWNAIATNYDEKQKRAFLLEMATGTGKTVLAALIISRFLRTNNASRVLFIVDRQSLANQTKGTFEQLLRNISTVGVYWGGKRQNLTGSNVVIATIQSLGLHGKKDFTPGAFDLIIHDEAHRSIYTPEARAAVDHFVGATKIGLTATPRDFLKNIDIEQLSNDDPRALERRIQRDTYRYFGCENGVPTFRYTIQDGSKAGYLIEPVYRKANTSLTYQALSDQGITKLDDVELEEGTSLKIRDLERKVFFPKRNRAMMQEFLDYADYAPNGEVGKTLIFAVSQNHALALTKILNELTPEYNGRFAEVITSRVHGAHEIAKDFANLNNKLPRVAVTVDMLATGFDAPEILNLVMARAIYDPTTYQQMKGRGTRLCPEVKKERFVIHDFAGVIDYFAEKHDWDVPLNAPANKVYGTAVESVEETMPMIRGSAIGEPIQEYVRASDIPTSNMQDFIATRDVVQYGLGEGDVVDRNMYQDEWTKAVHNYVKENREKVEQVIDDPEQLDELMVDINRELLDRPKYYFNEETLQQSHRVIAGVRDFFLAALGKTKLPTRDEQLAEFKQGLVNKFADSEGGASQRRTQMVKYLADHLMGDHKLVLAIRLEGNLSFLAKPEFAQAYTTRDWLAEFKDKDELLELISDIAVNPLLKV